MADAESAHQGPHSHAGHTQRRGSGLGLGSGAAQPHPHPVSTEASATGVGAMGGFLPSDDVRAYVEQLRAKYREEALEAVRTAEQRGAEKARAHGEAQMEAQQQQLETLQQSNLLLQSSLKKSLDGQTNIKEILELIYRGVKSEWRDDVENGNGRDVVGRMKNVLVTASQRLQQTFEGETCLVRPNNGHHSPSHHHNQNDNSTSFPVPTPTAIHRPKVLQVAVPFVTPKFYVEIGINHTDEMSVQRMIGHSTITKYTIESYYHAWTAATGNDGTASPQTIKFRQDRRFKEFLYLYQTLRKEFPMAMIPTLPEIDTSKELDRSLVFRRKRQLALWLQYITLHESLQLSDALQEFLSADPLGSQQRIQQQKQQEHRRHSYLSKRLADVDETKLSSNSRKALIRELAFRNILTVKRSVIWAKY
jgi:hypothetical protein